MRKTIINLLLCGIASLNMTSCENFLQTDYNEGVDVDNGLETVNNIEYAINGTYYQLFRQYFAGNYAITIGDMAGDMAYLNGSAAHWTTINHYNVTPNDSYLLYIWDYGYKVVDNSARIIKAGKELSGTLNETDEKNLQLYMAEAYGLRGYAMLMMTNIFGKQVKVNGTKDNSDAIGIVIVDEPVEAFAQVSRSSVGACYEAIINDFNKALECYAASGQNGRGVTEYLSVAAVEGLMARTYMYLEDFDKAKEYADKALKDSGKDVTAYTERDYMALYNGGDSNSESIFRLAIDSNNNWAANSCGNVWTTYGGLPCWKYVGIVFLLRSM